MKTSFKVLLLALLSTLPVVVRAEDYTYITNNGTITITGYTGTNAVVTIPGTITGLLVTSIGNKAFGSCTNLTNATIPNSITSIGQDAFCYCWGLHSVTIPASVTSIGDHAFYDCTSLTNLTIPTSVTSIGEHAFSFCARLTSVTIPNSVTNIVW